MGAGDVVVAGRERGMNLCWREIPSKNVRDEKAVARYAGVTGSPSESGSKQREKGLAKIRQHLRTPSITPMARTLPE